MNVRCKALEFLGLEGGHGYRYKESGPYVRDGTTRSSADGRRSSIKTRRKSHFGRCPNPGGIGNRRDEDTHLT